jgi:hypothetical protein
MHPTCLRRLRAFLLSGCKPLHNSDAIGVGADSQTYGGKGVEGILRNFYGIIHFHGRFVLN